MNSFWSLLVFSWVESAFGLHYGFLLSRGLYNAFQLVIITCVQLVVPRVWPVKPVLLFISQISFFFYSFLSGSVNWRRLDGIVFALLRSLGSPEKIIKKKSFFYKTFVCVEISGWEKRNKRLLCRCRHRPATCRRRNFMSERFPRLFDSCLKEREFGHWAWKFQSSLAYYFDDAERKRDRNRV